MIMIMCGRAEFRDPHSATPDIDDECRRGGAIQKAEDPDPQRYKTKVL